MCVIIIEQKLLRIKHIHFLKVKNKNLCDLECKTYGKIYKSETFGHTILHFSFTD